MSASEHAPVDRDSSKLFPFPDLFTPAAFPHAVRAVRLVETYISWILLTGSAVREASILGTFALATATR